MSSTCTEYRPTRHLRDRFVCRCRISSMTAMRLHRVGWGRASRASGDCTALPHGGVPKSEIRTPSTSEKSTYQLSVYGRNYYVVPTLASAAHIGYLPAAISGVLCRSFAGSALTRTRSPRRTYGDKTPDGSRSTAAVSQVGTCKADLLHDRRCIHQQTFINTRT